MTSSASSASSASPAPRSRGRPAGFRVPKTSEVIARWVRREIHDQRLKPGDALPSETQLREQFEVSRPTVREALRILEAQQLVRIARGATGGARYSLPDVAMVAEHTGIYLEAHRATQSDLTEARMNLEPCIVGYIAEHGDPKALEPLRASVEAHRSAIGDMVRFSREHERFYELLARLCPNITLGLQLRVFREIMGAQAELLGEELLAPGVEARASLEAHIGAKARLLDHIAAKDRAGAEKLWRKHLAAQLAHLLDTGRGGLPVKTW